jgi:hypothetical protein
MDIPMGFSGDGLHSEQRIAKGLIEENRLRALRGESQLEVVTWVTERSPCASMCYVDVEVAGVSRPSADLYYFIPEQATAKGGATEIQKQFPYFPLAKTDFPAGWPEAIPTGRTGPKGKPLFEWNNGLTGDAVREGPFTWNGHAVAVTDFMDKLYLKLGEVKQYDPANVKQYVGKGRGGQVVTIRD